MYNRCSFPLHWWQNLIASSSLYLYDERCKGSLLFCFPTMENLIKLIESRLRKLTNPISHKWWESLFMWLETKVSSCRKHCHDLITFEWGILFCVVFAEAFLICKSHEKNVIDWIKAKCNKAPFTNNRTVADILEYTANIFNSRIFHQKMHWSLQRKYMKDNVNEHRSHYH